MNALPEHRKMVHGRTWPSSHRHADWAGVEHYRRPLRVPSWLHKAFGVLFGLGVFALIGVLLSYSVWG